MLAMLVGYVGMGLTPKKAPVLTVSHMKLPIYK